MPRTKKPASKKSFKETDHRADIDALIKKIDLEGKKQIAAIENCRFNAILALGTKLKRQRLLLPKELLSKTVGELMQEDASCNSYFDYTAKSRFDKSRPRRSQSSHADEGYLTTESSESSIEPRRSRARARQIPVSQKVARSLSRSKLIRPPVGNAQRTPSNTKRFQTVSTVTPKVNPNTPSVMLRKPKNGETVISMQGSPLMVSTSLGEQKANINIPLPDGRIIAIQPERGLRMSQIPSFPDDVQQQLQMLRDNLNKVCSFKSNK